MTLFLRHLAEFVSTPPGVLLCINFVVVIVGATYDLNRED